MTRKALNLLVDDLALKIAATNGFDVSDRTGLARTYAMVAIALERLDDLLVEAGTAANRVSLPRSAEPTQAAPKVSLADQVNDTDAPVITVRTTVVEAA